VTSRERLALLLVALGAVALVVAAAAYGGWQAAVAVAGVLMLGGGVLLGLDTAPELPAAPATPELGADL
jgi:predicted phage tail protein